MNLYLKNDRLDPNFSRNEMKKKKKNPTKKYTLYVHLNSKVQSIGMHLDYKTDRFKMNNDELEF